jgi:transcriptional regulator with XRE-family HTH domain
MISSAKLRRLREKLRLSQAEVADQIEVSQSTFSDWESAKSQPHPKYWQKIAEALKASMDDFVEESSYLKFLKGRVLAKEPDEAPEDKNEKLDAVTLIGDLLKSKEAEITSKELLLEMEKKYCMRLEEDNKKLAEECISTRLQNQELQFENRYLKNKLDELKWQSIKLKEEY